MNELAFALVVWISSVTGYPVPSTADLPEIMQMTSAELKVKVMGANAEKSDYEILGGYDVKENKLYLSTSFNPQNIRSQSDLVHEWVHFLQVRNRTRQPLCDNGDEAEAYTVENQWMKEHGLPPAVPEQHIVLMSLCNVDSVDDAVAILKSEMR